MGSYTSLLPSEHLFKVIFKIRVAKEGLIAAQDIHYTKMQDYSRSLRICEEGIREEVGYKDEKVN